MEEAFPYSLKICQNIIEDTIFNRACDKLPPSKTELKLYSSKKSEAVADMILQCTKHSYDNPSNRLSQDTEAMIYKNKSFITHKITYIPAQQQIHKRKASKTQSIQENTYEKCNGLGLVPLYDAEAESQLESDEEQIEARMRDVKMHQEHVRTRYMETLKQGKNRKQYTVHKNQGKTLPKVGVYDYDGTLIEPLKFESKRLPGHYIDLQVQVQNKQVKLGPSSKLMKKKTGKNVKFEAGSRGIDILQATESIFLKEFNKTQWIEGVEVLTGKEECRKILGYNQSQNIRKKKIDLLKPSEQKKQIRLEDLQNCRGFFRNESAHYLSAISEKSIKRQHSVFSKAEYSKADGPQIIKVANNRALNLLISQEPEQPKTYSKKSAFASSKKFLHSFHN